MSTLILAVIFSIVVVVGTYLFAFRISGQTIQKMNQQLQALAEALELPAPIIEQSGLSAFYSGRVSGPINGLDFEFQHYTRSTENAKSYVTSFQWTLSKKDYPSLTIGKEGMLSNIKKQFGQEDILATAEDFDAIFLIRSDDEAFAKAFLSETMRSEFLKWNRQIHGCFKLQAGLLQYEEMGVLLEKRDLDRIIRIIELSQVFIEELEK